MNHPAPVTGPSAEGHADHSVKRSPSGPQRSAPHGRPLQGPGAGGNDSASFLARHPWIVCAVLVLILGLVVRLNLRSGDTDPHLTASQLGSLPDDQIVSRAYVELLLRVGNDARPADWKRFSQPARHVWALGLVESAMTGMGIAGYMKAPARTDRPGLAEARAACEAMDLSWALQALAEADAIVPTGPAGDSSRVPSGASMEKPMQGADPYAAVTKRFLSALQNPASIKARADYIRGHLAEITEP